MSENEDQIRLLHHYAIQLYKTKNGSYSRTNKKGISEVQLYLWLMEKMEIDMDAADRLVAQALEQGLITVVEGRRYVHGRRMFIPKPLDEKESNPDFSPISLVQDGISRGIPRKGKN